MDELTYRLMAYHVCGDDKPLTVEAHYLTFSKNGRSKHIARWDGSYFLKPTGCPLPDDLQRFLYHDSLLSFPKTMQSLENQYKVEKYTILESLTGKCISLELTPINQIEFFVYIPEHTKADFSLHCKCGDRSWAYTSQHTANIIRELISNIPEMRLKYLFR